MDKLLWHSNAPFAPTGYGQQTGLFAPELAKHYDVAISANYGLEGAPFPWKGVPVLPGLGGTEVGNIPLPEHARVHFGGDIRDGLVVTLYDVFAFDPTMIEQLNAACWCPVDHDPVPPGTARFFERSGAVPLAMSRFGEEQLAPFDPIYIPHGVNVDIYKPQDREVSRASVGLPEDAFVVGMVAANKGRPSRKGFQQAFEAFRYFREKHDNAHLYLHTIVLPEHGSGEDIPALLASLEIPEDSITVANQYRMMYMPFSQENMALIYSALDVLLNPAYGEGFGIPILEAQACGVPCIVSDFTAMKEVCKVGWKIPVRPFWTGHNSWQGVPEVGEILKSLEAVYTLTPDKRASMAKKARRHALDYAVPKVVKEHFLPALEEVQKRYSASVEVVG